MHFEDKTLTCKECSDPFTWSAGEQQFYKEKDLINIPARCPRCRGQRKAKLGLPERTITEVVCAECNQKTTVPFIPRNGNPVYCSACFEGLKRQKDTTEQASTAQG